MKKLLMMGVIFLNTIGTAYGYLALWNKTGDKILVTALFYPTGSNPNPPRQVTEEVAPEQKFSIDCGRRTEATIKVELPYMGRWITFMDYFHPFRGCGGGNGNVDLRVFLSAKGEPCDQEYYVTSQDRPGEIPNVPYQVIARKSRRELDMCH